MATGAQLLALAETRIGEKYINVQVPKDNANWHGPWDCAEFASWLVYQKTGKLDGCIDNSDDPALADAYSGAWVRDAIDDRVEPITQREANGIAGAVLIRRPPAPGKMGHIAITDGRGGTVEAAGINLGVRRDRVEGRLWHFVVTIPELTYTSTGQSRERARRKQLVGAMEVAVDWYHRRLLDDPAARPARDYLRSRGITATEFVTSFRVGYADGTLAQKLPAEGRRALRRIGVLTGLGT